MKSINYVYTSLIALVTLVLSCMLPVLTHARVNQCVDLFKQQSDVDSRVVYVKSDGSEITAKEVKERLTQLTNSFFQSAQELRKAQSNNNEKEKNKLTAYQQELSRQIGEIIEAKYIVLEFNEYLREFYVGELARISKEYESNSSKRVKAAEREKERRVREEEARKEREREAKEKASDPIHKAKVNKIIFHDIAPGEFMMGEVGRQVKTEIKQPFAMMQTLFTQMMYSRLMIAFGETDAELINPSCFQICGDSMKVTFNDVTYSMKPDHPVEQVSWSDLRGDVAPNKPPSPESFLGKLNNLSKSEDQRDQELLQKLIPGHQKGDIYDLPTEAQIEFVMRNRGKANNEYFDREDSSELGQYAWSKENSGRETHAVNTLQPRMIDRGDGVEVPMYHLEGNVWTWNKDSWDGEAPLLGGTDPLSTSGSGRVVRGGAWHYDAQDLRLGHRGYLSSPVGRYYSTGFRLVRTRP